MSTQRQVRRGTTAEIASMSTPAEGEWLYDTSRKAGVWGDGSEDDGIPAPNFAELVNNTWTGFTAVQNGSPADPNDLTITIDERFNKAAFLNGATFKTFARFYVKIPANNTGAVNLTVEFGSGGSTITKDLKKIDAAAAPAELEADDLVEGGIYSVVFDGTQWLVVGGLGGGGGGGLVLIESQEITASVATVDFTTGIDGTYDEYRLIGAGLTVTASAGRPAIRFSTDGGSTWASGASDYRHAHRRLSTSTSWSDSADSADSQIWLLDSLLDTTTTDALAFEFRFFRPASTALHKFCMFEAVADRTGLVGAAGGRAVYLSTSAVDGVQLLTTSTDQYDDGWVALYGVAKA